MRYKYIIWIPMFLAFALATPSMGAFVSLGLPNGMSASVENNGGAAGSTTMSYEISDAGPLVDYIQGDILAVAHIDDELIGPGIATAQADAEDDLGDIVVNEADEDADLEISLKGEVNAYAQSSDAETTSDDGATVTSVGLIRAYAGAKELDDCGYPDRVFGDAQIYSGIGRFWTEDFEDADFGMGELIGEPEGMFFASANAEGAATYSALIGGEDEPTASVSGSTEGATTIEAAVGDEAGSIGGYLDGLEAEDPANAKLSSHSIADLPTYLDGGVWTKSTSKSRVELAAANDLSEPTSVGSYASGTAEGTTNGFAEVAGPNYDDIWITTSSTQIDDASNSADVNVLKNFDVAEAFSGLEVKSEADEYDAHVYSDAETDALVGRSFMYPGSDPNGKDRVGATAFIGSGSWNALADFTSTDLYDFQTETQYSASLSGELGQVTDPTTVNGMGAGAFLQFGKNGAAYAETRLQQAADADNPWDPYGDLHTWQRSYTDINGPSAVSILHTPSTWDGVGVYAAGDNLNVEASNGKDPITTQTWSTDVPDVEGYMWVDGTNNKMFNGPGFTITGSPVLTPGGSVVGPAYDQSPSLTQRETQVEFETEQPFED